MDGPSVPEVDVERANSARVYDYFLGGAHNFAVDRELGDRIAESMPIARSWARANRAFLMRAVRFCVEQGVRQFLDLGSGIATADHVHGTARALAPETRVAYVDIEPVAVAHSRELLAGVPGTSITRADVRDPAAVLASPGVAEVLDLREPVAVLAVSVVHFIPDAEEPEAILGRYREVLSPGSFMALSHGSADYDDPQVRTWLTDAADLYRHSTTPIQLRDRPRLHALLGGLPLVDPGLVDIARWRGEDESAQELGSYAGVAIVG